MTPKAVSDSCSDERSKPKHGIHVRRAVWAAMAVVICQGLICGAWAAGPGTGTLAADPGVAPVRERVVDRYESLPLSFEPKFLRTPNMLHVRLSREESQPPAAAVDLQAGSGEHSFGNAAGNGVPALRNLARPAVRMPFLEGPTRLWATMSAWSSAHIEGGPNSWRRWPIRFLMASADQFDPTTMAFGKRSGAASGHGATARR